MKYFSFIGLFLTSVLILNGCSKKIPVSKTYEKKGVLLEYYVDKPITGLVDEGNGTIKSYKDGILDGESTIISSYDKSIVNYKNGILNGKVRYYHEGDLTCECNYKDGLLDGLFTNFHEGYFIRGKESFEGTFQRGKAIGGKFIKQDNNGNILTQFDIDPTMDIKKIKYYNPSSNLDLKIKNLKGWEDFYYMNDPIITPIKILMNESKYNFSEIIKNSPQMIAKDENGMYVNNFIIADYGDNNNVYLRQALFYLNDEYSPIEYACNVDIGEIEKARDDINKLLTDYNYSIVGEPVITSRQLKDVIDITEMITTTVWENKSNGSVSLIKVAELFNAFSSFRFIIRHLRISK